MNLPSARPNEKVVEQFTIANSYSVAQIILALIIPFIFYGLFIGAKQIGLTNIFPETAMFWTFIFIGLLIGLYIVIAALYLRLARHYFVTSERIIQVIGWLAQSSISIDYATITDMDVNQDIFERFFINSGTLKIDTAGSMEKILLFNIARPYHLRDEIFGYIEQEKKFGINPTAAQLNINKSTTSTAPQSTPPPTSPAI